MWGSDIFHRCGSGQHCSAANRCAAVRVTLTGKTQGGSVPKPEPSLLDVGQQGPEEGGSARSSLFFISLGCYNGFRQREGEGERWQRKRRAWMRPKGAGVRSCWRRRCSVNFRTGVSELMETPVKQRPSPGENITKSCRHCCRTKSRTAFMSTTATSTPNSNFGWSLKDFRSGPTYWESTTRKELQGNPSYMSRSSQR